MIRFKKIQTKSIKISFKNKILIVIYRHEWDQFITSKYDPKKSIPIEWIEPNQEPNEEWSKFIKITENLKL